MPLSEPFLELKQLFLYFANGVYLPHLVYTFYHLHDYLSFRAQNNFSFECSMICKMLFHG
jgi:hypothetical protein